MVLRREEEGVKLEDLSRPTEAALISGLGGEEYHASVDHASLTMSLGSLIGLACPNGHAQVVQML